ncbi:MAG: hydroxylamine reductase, partial [Chloroflexi bacterium]|nr:hydroxylamine reductase [Chloroflexota bacterium]
MSMFCFQCQETAKNQGCTVRGVCGKTDDVAHLQDLLIWLLKGMSFYGVKAREVNASDPEADLFVAQSLFSTITNVNFDPERFVPLVEKALALRDRLKVRFLKAYQQAHGRAFSEPLPEMATWVPEKGDMDEFVQKGATVGVMADPNLNEDVRSLRQLLTYGLKGLAAYMDHAYILGHHDDALLTFLQEGLVATTDEDALADDLVGMVLKC